MNYISAKDGEKLSNQPYLIDSNTLKSMLAQNERDKAECRSVTESSYRGESYYANDGRPGSDKVANWRAAFFKECLYRDRKTDGFSMLYPHGNIIQQGELNSYYRGENQVHLRSVPILQRRLNDLPSENDRMVYKFVAAMRILEFRFLISQFDLVKRWEAQYSDVLYELLAQHYGLETLWIDITSDLEVALFFAACQWDDEKKKWRPLTQEEVDKFQYGVIFHIPGHRATLNALVNDTSDIPCQNVIRPVGYQPFMRCHSQHAYAIHMENPFPLQEDISFEKLHFRHSVKLSQTIFHKMEEGKLIYPQEGLNDFDDLIDQIKHATTFSQEAFCRAFEQSSDFKNEDECRQALKACTLFHKPIIISKTEHPIKVSRQRLKRFNQKYEKFDIEKAYGIRRVTRSIYYPI
nr:FRG domain-containing protein [uncultured Butyricicoccus sp.]